MSCGAARPSNPRGCLSYRDAQPQLASFSINSRGMKAWSGWTALFVGGIGVAPSIHAFVREKLPPLRF